MADTFTTNLNLTKPEPGAAEDTWGISLNSDLDTLDAIFSSSGTQVNLNPNQVNFADDKKAIFGSGNSLKISHDGTDALIQNAIGDFIIRNTADDKDIILQSDNGSGGLVAYITLDGSEVHSVFSRDAKFTDGIKAKFGNAEDLQIYHDGGNSRILDNGTGFLAIGTNGSDIRLTGNSFNEYMAKFVQDGAVELYFNNLAKLATTSSGIDVTGSITTDGLTSVGGFISIGADGAGDDFRFYGDTSGRYMEWVSSVDSLLFRDGAKALFGSGSDLQIYHNGTQNYIEDAGTGNLNFKSNGNNFNFLDGSDNLVLQIDLNSATKLYHNTSEKLATTSTGIDVTGAIETDGVNSSVNIKVQREFPAIQLENTVTTGRNAWFKQIGNRLDLVSQNVTTNGLITFRGYDGTTESEWARFAASGNFLVGKTGTGVNQTGFQVVSNKCTITNDSDNTLILNRTTSDGVVTQYRKDGTTVGSVQVSDTATTYNTTSDARLKDVTGEARGLEVITKLNPVAYNWKADGKADEGLIAQEVKEIVPNAVSGSEDEHYQMDYSKLVTHLVAGMKEQQEQIESLKSEIAKLKGE